MSSPIPNLFVSRGSTLTMILATLAVLASCATKVSTIRGKLPAPTIRAVALVKGNPNDPWIVTIHFENATSCVVTHVTEDPATCQNAPEPGFCVSHNEFVRWVSDPANIMYNIYFSPIHGNPLPSNAIGVLTRPTLADAPYSLYKYSILRNGCDADTDTYDPHMRVDE